MPGMTVAPARSTIRVVGPRQGHDLGVVPDGDDVGVLDRERGRAWG
jgi:hypothetical protein